ncbi:hypothetical protein [Streptomyces sp. NPDC091383]|uniref:hypothetical protein n=1 Tax=Streptomyces sp. NPDC091383 TaxID=3365996 RepID=UPI00380DF2DF
MTANQDLTAIARPAGEHRWTVTAPGGRSVTVDEKEFHPRAFTEHLRLLGYYTSNVGPVLNGGSPWERAADGSRSTPVHPVAQAAAHNARVQLLDGRWVLGVDDEPGQPYGETGDPFSSGQATRQLIHAGYEIPGLEYHRPQPYSPWVQSGEGEYTTVCYRAS